MRYCCAYYRVGVFSIQQETWLHKLSSKLETRHKPLWWTIFMEFYMAPGFFMMRKSAFGLANKNSWIIWFRTWILFAVSEKSRWNDWRLFWRSQSCKNQTLILVGRDFSLVLCSLRTKHGIGAQDAETVHKKSTGVYFINKL